MVFSYKGRSIKIGQVVKVYFNLHNNLFSIMDKETGLVLGHSERVLLVNPVFEVNKKGRERVLKEKRKNVHAFVIGTYLGNPNYENLYDFKKVYYNPYKVDKFCVGEEKTHANKSNFVLAYLDGKNVYGI